MRIEETFSVARPPKVVFDYVIQAGNLADWQTSKTFVEQITAKYHRNLRRNVEAL
jgi:hypothetical protein